MCATILSLNTAVPSKAVTQDEFIEKTGHFLNLNEAERQLLERLSSSSKIEKRHTVLDDYFDEGGFYGGRNGTYPSTEKRSLCYKEKAPVLAERACKGALELWGGHSSEITHIISVSCTGMIAPGIEFLMIDKLALKPNVERLGINFMGCFGAFKGLTVAKALSLEDPSHRVLLVCTELCSLHFKKEFSKESLIGNSLFADGAAATVIGTKPRSFEKPLFHLEARASHALSDTLDAMTWEIGDFGYLMHISATVPNHIEEHILAFVKSLLKDVALSACGWAIHPGGKAILNAIAKACNINQEQISASWNVLKDFGNMSSATFLFVLNEILKTKSHHERYIGLGFGPGLSIEGLLLKRL